MKSIKLSQLHPDPRSANHMSTERRKKLKANYQFHKRFPALIVRPHPKKIGEFMIIDGLQRFEVAVELGLKALSCDIWEVDEKQAGLLLAILNRIRGEDIPRSMAPETQRRSISTRRSIENRRNIPFG